MAHHWQESFATQDTRIDEQHQQLFRFAEKLEALAQNPQATEREVASLLSFLDSYIQNHFRYEEACMLKRGCPVAQRNRAEHLAFKATFDRSVGAYRKDGFSQSWAADLHSSLTHWLTHHICHTDLQLRDYPDPARPD